jgi:O-antigen ligase
MLATALSLCMALLSGSSTTIVVLGAAAILTPLYVLLGGQIHLAIAGGSAALLVAGVAVTLFLVDPSRVLGLVGRDATLTGRTQLWLAVAAFIAMRPWLGHGYQAFWFGEEGTADVKDMAGWAGASAHNGFLDLALALGLVGLALFALKFLISAGKASVNLRRARGLEGIWPLAFLAYFFLYNITETSVLIPTDILWAVYVGTCLSLSPAAVRAADRAARRARHGRPEFAEEVVPESLPEQPEALAPRAWAPRR